MTFGRQLVLLDYVKRKYTQLVSFDLYEPQADEWSHRETSRFTTTGIIPFIKYYGQQMKSMGLESLEEKPNLFVILDELDCKLLSFSVDTLWGVSPFRVITASNQCKFIQELSLKHYDIFDDGDLEFPYAPFEQLDKFVSLRKLTLNYQNNYVDYRARVNLNDLLDSCSNTLKSLTIEDATLTFNINPNQSQEQYNLCKLQLYGADVPNEFGYFLSQYCQKLTHIKLTGYKPFVTTIDIPTMYLSCFDIKSPTSEDALDLSVSTIADGRQRYYSIDHTYEWRGFLDKLIDEHSTSVCNTVSTVPVPTNPPFKLICASVDTILINHFLAR